jgi:hypothetical protein
MSADITTQLHVQYDGSTYEPMPVWAKFYFDLGYQIGRMKIVNDMYLRVVIVAPVTDYIATFISLGNLIAQSSQSIDINMHFQKLLALPTGSKMVRIYNNWDKQRVEKIDIDATDQIAFKYKDKGRDTVSQMLVNEYLLNVMPVYVNDKAVNNNRYNIELRQDIVCNSLFTSHFSHIINPVTPYAMIIGSIVGQNEELGLSCYVNQISFSLNELLITNQSVLLQPNLLLASSQMRSDLDDINVNLVIFTDANGILNHSHEINNRHHVYILDYHDNNLDSAMGHIQNQFVYRCDETVQLQNNYQFKSAEVSAYFVKGY